MRIAGEQEVTAKDKFKVTLIVGSFSTPLDL